MRRKTLVIVSLLVIALMLVSSVPVGAKGKPSKDPPGGGDDPTGTIFYGHTDTDDVYYIYSMNADGSSKTKEVQWVDGMDGLSIKTHKDGHYWYVGFVRTTGSHPDGVSKTKLVAIRDDNGKTVTLLDDPTMSYDDWNGPPVWLSNDGHLSWSALKWASGDTIAEAGIYKADITWGDNDDDPDMSTPILVWSTSTWNHGAYALWYTPEVSDPSWTADGKKVVMFSIDNDNTVVNFNTVPPTESHYDFLGWPLVSPDGTKLAYQWSDKLHVVDLDTSDDTILISYKSGKKVSKNMKNVRWSPDSKHLMYTISSWNLNNWDESAKVYTIGVDGTGNTCVSNGITVSDSVWGRYWR